MKLLKRYIAVKSDNYYYLIIAGEKIGDFANGLCYENGRVELGFNSSHTIAEQCRIDKESNFFKKIIIDPKEVDKFLMGMELSR